MLCSLHLLFDKNLDRALQIVDKGQVKCYVAQDSQRKLFVVRLWVSGFPEDVAPQRIRTLSRRPLRRCDHPWALGREAAGCEA